MLLRVGNVAGYNNLIIIATDTQSLGLNRDLNKDVAPPDATNDTGEGGLVKPASGDITTQPPAPAASEATTSQPDATSAKLDVASSNSDHEDEKTALVVGGIAIGLGLLWFLR